MATYIKSGKVVQHKKTGVVALLFPVTHFEAAPSKKRTKVFLVGNASWTRTDDEFKSITAAKKKYFIVANFKR